MTLRLQASGAGFTELKAASGSQQNSIFLPSSNGAVYQLLQNSSSAGTLAFTQDVSVDGSGALLVGTNALNAGPNPGGVSFPAHVVVQGNSGSDAGPAGVQLRRGSTPGTTLPVDPEIADIYFNDHQSQSGAKISALAEGGWSNSQHPTSLAFSTVNTGSTSLQERLRISQDGTLKLSNSPGIDFDNINGSVGTGATAQGSTLNAYEQGVWTPTLNQGTATVQYANYTRIGRLVHVKARLDNFSQTTGTTNVLVSGLPFAASNLGCCAGSVIGANISNSSYTSVFIGGTGAGHSIKFGNLSQTTFSFLQYSNFTASTSVLIFQATYIIGG